MCRYYNYKPSVYKWCIDCGEEKSVNIMRNCQKCMDGVQKRIIHSKCAKCNLPPVKKYSRLCSKHYEEVKTLNQKFNQSIGRL